MSFSTTVLELKRQTCFWHECCLFWGKMDKQFPFSFGFLPSLRLIPATIVALSSTYAQDASPLQLEKEIPLPGVEGRIDHFSVDVLGQRLFVAALENGTV